MRKLLLSLVLIVGLLAGCGESTVEKVEGDAGQEKQEKQKQEVFKVGDSVKFDDLKITLTKVRKAKSDFMTPQNDQIIAVELQIENTSDKPQNVSSLLQMKLVDPDGRSYDMTITGNERGSLDGEIGPGRKMTGEIAFDVEKGDYYEFLFENPFTTGQAIWKIENKDIK